MKYKIIYSKNRCVGNKVCLVSSQFKFDDKEDKAFLSKNSKAAEIVVDLTEEEVKKLIEAGNSCPVNAIGVYKLTENGYTEIVRMNVSEKEGGAKIIHAEYDDMKEFVMDKFGYFLIRVNKDTRELEIGHCPEVNKIVTIIKGHNPLPIYQAAIKEGLIERMDHAAYLGRELQKAYDSLVCGVEYVQDDEFKGGK